MDIVMQPRPCQNKIDILNKARTELLEAYLELFEENLNRAKELNILDYEQYKKDSKIITIQVGRRMGSSTWVKNYLINNPKSVVICPEDFKKRMYKGLNAVSVDSLIKTPPTSFTDKVVFIDLPPTKVHQVLEKHSFIYYCKCVVII